MAGHQEVSAKPECSVNSEQSVSIQLTVDLTDKTRISWFLIRAYLSNLWLQPPDSVS
jgi:hypothetical protein